MIRRLAQCLLVCAFVLGASVLPVAAQGAQERVVEQLKDQGYARIQITRTLLGRTRIVATGAASRREIILNTNTGEILRDYWEAEGRRPADSSTGGTIISVPQSGPADSGSGGATGSGGDSRDDDSYDDDDDDSYDDDSDDDDSDDDSDDGDDDSDDDD